VQSGRLGKNVNAHVAIGGAPNEGPFESTPVPEGLNWDMWVGPAPQADYSEERRRMFRWWFEYSGGKMTDWGAHHIDIAQWALGYDNSGPVKARGSCNFPSIVPASLDWNAFLGGESSLPDGYNTAVDFNIDLEFANGSVMSVSDNYKREGTNIDFGNGILFEGDEGRIFVNRGKLEGKPIDDLTAADNDEINDRVIALYKGRKPQPHMQNFFDCVADREQPISDVVTHHRTMTSCHLCNLTLMLDRELNWDPTAETFVGDDEAVALMSRKRRAEYDISA
jgi:myo-inositol 2-dehydrogenase/D-chiro-inositol 1-dehydrogenase